jgi:hypothetical protein
MPPWDSAGILPWPPEREGRAPLGAGLPRRAPLPSESPALERPAASPSRSGPPKSLTWRVKTAACPSKRRRPKAGRRIPPSAVSPMAAHAFRRHRQPEAGPRIPQNIVSPKPLRALSSGGFANFRHARRQVAPGGACPRRPWGSLAWSGPWGALAGGALGGGRRVARVARGRPSGWASGGGGPRGAKERPPKGASLGGRS